MAGEVLEEPDKATLLKEVPLLEFGEDRIAAQPAESGGSKGEKGRGLQEDELPADAIKTKKIHFDQVRAIAMAPHDRLGALGWSAVSGFAAALPGAYSDIQEAYKTNPPALLLSHSVNLLIVAFFLGLGVFAIVSHRGRMADDLLFELFPNTKPQEQPHLIIRIRRWMKGIYDDFTSPL